MDTPNGLAELYLIRHGETDWSLSGRHTGRSDVALTTRGEQEAEALGARWRHLVFDHVFTSPRLRARRTCELSGWAGGAEVDEDLAEWDYGDYEGLRSRDIQVDRPEWSLFHDGCPGGESPAQVAIRADRLIERLRKLTGRVAVFSHGHFSRAVGVRWIGLPVAEGRHFALGTASLSVLGYEHGLLERSAILHWNVMGICSTRH